MSYQQNNYQQRNNQKDIYKELREQIATYILEELDSDKPKSPEMLNAFSELIRTMLTIKK